MSQQELPPLETITLLLDGKQLESHIQSKTAQLPSQRNYLNVQDQTPLGGHKRMEEDQPEKTGKDDSHMVQTCQANKWQSAVLRGLNWSIRKDPKLFLSLQGYSLWPKQTSQIFQVPLHSLRRGRCSAHLSRQKKAGNCNLASVIGAMKERTLMVYTSLHTLLTHCSIIKPSYCHVMGCKKSCCEMYPNDALPKWQSPHAACIYFPRLDWFTTTIPQDHHLDPSVTLKVRLKNKGFPLQLHDTVTHAAP